MHQVSHVCSFRDLADLQCSQHIYSFRLEHFFKTISSKMCGGIDYNVNTFWKLDVFLPVAQIQVYVTSCTTSGYHFGKLGKNGFQCLGQGRCAADNQYPHGGPF